MQHNAAQSRWDKTMESLELSSPFVSSSLLGAMGRVALLDQCMCLSITFIDFHHHLVPSFRFGPFHFSLRFVV